MLNMSSVYCT